MTTQEKNKAVVTKFNKGFIEGGDQKVFDEIISPEFINHTAPVGVPKGPEGVQYFFNNFLKSAFPGLRVVIHDQVAEGDKVTTRKAFHAEHKGEFMGISPTNNPVVMDVIDIIHLKDGKFIEHWNILDWQSVIQQIQG